MKNKLLLKSFGLGIMSAEIVPAPPPSKPNGDRSGVESEVLSSMKEAGVEPLEAAVDPEDKSRVYLLMSEGHLPSRYELSQMEQSDWERLRTAVDLHGSGRFSDRLTALEEEKQSFLEASGQ